MQQLRLLDELIVRSVFHALRDYAIQLGYFPDISIYPDPKAPAAIADYKNKLKDIELSKGFNIEFFSESSTRNKGEKTAPRIIVSLDRSFGGEIGAPPHQIMKNDGLDTYRLGAMPARATNLIIAVYLISHSSQQTYVLNGIKDNILGEKNYIKIHNNPTLDPFYIYRTGFYNLDDPTENLTERGYLYTVPDVYIGDDIIINDNISAIKEITLEIKDPDDEGLIINN